jgi:hypothetical protein
MKGRSQGLLCRSPSDSHSETVGISEALDDDEVWLLIRCDSKWSITHSSPKLCRLTRFPDSCLATRSCRMLLGPTSNEAALFSELSSCQNGRGSSPGMHVTLYTSDSCPFVCAARTQAVLDHSSATVSHVKLLVRPAQHQNVGDAIAAAEAVHGVAHDALAEFGCGQTNEEAGPGPGPEECPGPVDSRCAAGAAAVGETDTSNAPAVAACADAAAPCVVVGVVERSDLFEVEWQRPADGDDERGGYRAAFLLPRDYEGDALALQEQHTLSRVGHALRRLGGATPATRTPRLESRPLEKSKTPVAARPAPAQGGPDTAGHRDTKLVVILDPGDAALRECGRLLWRLRELGAVRSWLWDSDSVTVSVCASRRAGSDCALPPAWRLGAAAGCSGRQRLAQLVSDPELAAAARKLTEVAVLDRAFAVGEAALTAIAAGPSAAPREGRLEAPAAASLPPEDAAGADEAVAVVAEREPWVVLEVSAEWERLFGFPA